MKDIIVREIIENSLKEAVTLEKNKQDCYLEARPMGDIGYILYLDKKPYRLIVVTNKEELPEEKICITIYKTEKDIEEQVAIFFKNHFCSIFTKPS